MMKQNKIDSNKRSLKLYNIFNKIHSKNGESISEVLVASLVIAFGSILLASMVVASSRIIKKSIASYGTYTAFHNEVEMLDAEGNTAIINGDGTETKTKIDPESENEATVTGKVYAYSGSSDLNQFVDSNLSEPIKIYTVPESVAAGAKSFTKYFPAN